MGKIQWRDNAENMLMIYNVDMYAIQWWLEWDKKKIV